MRTDVKSHTEFSISGWVGVAYTLNSQDQLDRQYFDQYILEGVQSKIQYASLDNLIDLTTVLASIGYNDTDALYEQVADLLAAKLAVSLTHFYNPSPYFYFTGGQFPKFKF